MAMAQRKITQVSEILHVLRLRAMLSIFDVAFSTGVDIHTVRKWEKGEATPTELSLKRLYELFPELKHATDCLPRILIDQIKSRALAVGNRGQELWVPPSALPGEDPPEFVLSFHQVLASIMADESLEIEDVRSMFDLPKGLVERWCTGEVLPTREHYQQLVDVWPQLLQEPKPGEPESWVRVIKPFLQAVPMPAPTLPTPPVLPKQDLTATVVVPVVAPTSPLPPALPPLTPPPIPKIEAFVPPDRQKKKVDHAAVEYGQAMVALEHARKYREELVAQLVQLDAELKDLENQAQEAEKAFWVSVRKAADEM
jgi:transcriptional regulator with XRE-family HTH domain